MLDYNYIPATKPYVKVRYKGIAIDTTVIYQTNIISEWNSDKTKCRIHEEWYEVIEFLSQEELNNTKQQ